MALTVIEPYKASLSRYDEGVMPVRKCGASSLKLPVLSLGFWWNFGGVDPYQLSVDKMKIAFDNGIFCFDLANNYGPPFGSAEETFGRAFRENFRPYRHEMIVTTKAGFNMWQGPNGNGSSRKMLMTSIDESLSRMGLDYVDVFYSHRYDGVTPIEETMQALVDIVRQGKALYVGLSNYPADVMGKAFEYLDDRDTHCLIYQGKYNMMVRDVEKNHFDVLNENNVGFTAFVPLAQGLLSDKYLNGIPADSRAARNHHLSADDITPELRNMLSRLNSMAERRGQSLAQMATAWLIAKENVTSVIIGPRTVEQLNDSIAAVRNTAFSAEELDEIDKIMKL